MITTSGSAVLRAASAARRETANHMIKWALCRVHATEVACLKSLNIQVKIYSPRVKHRKKTPEGGVPLLPYSDVTITVRGEAVVSSRAYLAAYSPVLDATFSDSFREGQQMIVTYDDIDPSDFAEFLLAIYPEQKDIEGLVSFASALQIIHDKSVFS